MAPAPRLLLSFSDGAQSVCNQKENVVFQQANPQQPKSKMFKILCPIEKKGGGTYWARCGTAYENRDESINCYLDFFPKDWKFQIRVFDAEDIRRMNERSANAGSSARGDAWRTTTAPYAGSAFNLPRSNAEDDASSMSSVGRSMPPAVEDTTPF